MITTRLPNASSSELRCTYQTVIIRNESLNQKFPGGLSAFVNRYRAECNDHITVYCHTGSEIGDMFRALEAVGLEHSNDFATLDTIECEMWRLIHSEKVNRPFWFETGADWLQCKHRQGSVWVWYNG
ncbi:MAG: hypothetical protein JJV98_09335 [Desulfosarcina sp.]|nr:hypothetical protein [Desulfobacterales bacterium]